MDDWGSIDFGWGEPQEPKPQKEKQRHLSGRATAVLTHSDRYQMRRAYSEIGILDCVGFSELKEGDRWHFISAGDVDSLSFLKLILRHQDLTYCLFSTWVMAAEDILTFDELLTAGKIKHLDCYLGEIFPGSYPTEWAMLTEMISRHNKSRGGGNKMRIAIFRNHSKVYAGYGDKFHFAIESSANINTNPRTEQTCIEISQPLYEFYRDYYDGIKSFEKYGND